MGRDSPDGSCERGFSHERESCRPGGYTRSSRPDRSNWPNRSGRPDGLDRRGRRCRRDGGDRHGRPCGRLALTFTVPPGPGDIFYNDGNVGIGTNAPGARLDVRGNIKLGPAGEFNAVGGDVGESLRIIRGTAFADGTVTNGTGWSVARTAGQPAGDYKITFTTPFSGLPVVTATTITNGNLITAVVDGTITTTIIGIRTFNTAGAQVDSKFSFIAVGPR